MCIFRFVPCQLRNSYSSEAVGLGLTCLFGSPLFYTLTLLLTRARAVRSYGRGPLRWHMHSLGLRSMGNAMQAILSEGPASIRVVLPGGTNPPS